MIRGLTIGALLLVAACSPTGGSSPTTNVVPTTVVTSTTTSTTTSSTTTTTSTTTTLPPLVYVFPFTGRNVSYGTDHHDYPAVDVFGCGAAVVAPVRGRVLEIRTEDLWPGSGNNPAYRGGLYVSLGGDDGVRYYFAHLESVAVTPGQNVVEGAQLGIMGDSGNAAQSACHTHFGVSWTCGGVEWMVRRGKIWPQPYLDAWKSGSQLSPRVEIDGVRAAEPDACAEALADSDAPLA